MEFGFNEDADPQLVEPPEVHLSLGRRLTGSTMCGNAKNANSLSISRNGTANHGTWPAWILANKRDWLSAVTVTSIRSLSGALVSVTA